MYVVAAVAAVDAVAGAVAVVVSCVVTVFVAVASTGPVVVFVSLLDSEIIKGGPRPHFLFSWSFCF